MEGLDGFLDRYGLAAACAVMLTKALGVPVPVPGDVILLATAARAAEGKLVLWIAFVAGLLASVVAPSPLLIVVVLAALGLLAWLVVARRRGASRTFAVRAWAQASC